jgi:hypothetical protein
VLVDKGEGWDVSNKRVKLEGNSKPIPETWANCVDEGNRSVKLEGKS